MKKLTSSVFLYLLLSSSIFFAKAQNLYEQNVRSILEALAADSVEKAEELILETVRLDASRQSNALLYQYLGEIYQRRGDDGKALMAYNASIDILPTERSLFFRAFIHYQNRRYKEARADYEKLLELNPTHEDGRLGLALLNSKDGRPREAFEQLDALVRVFPSHAKHYLARCGLYIERKEFEKAKRDAQMAIELEPDNADCYLTRGSLYLAMKKRKLAQQDLRKAISLGASPEQVADLLGASR